MIGFWMTVVYGVGGGLAVLLLGNLFLCCIRFACCYTRRHSYAAIHSDIGGVDAGSCSQCLINLILFVIGYAATLVLIVLKVNGGLNPDSEISSIIRKISNFETNGMFTVWEIIGAGVGVGFAAVIIPYICMCILGFTCGGVRGGSYAAGVHSGIGDVEAGSCFACCQSAGAGGMSCCCQFFLFLIGFVTTVTLMAVYNPEDIGPTLEPPTIIPTNFSQLISTTTPLPQLM